MISLPNLLISLTQKLNIYSLARKCTKKYPVYWAIEESEDPIICCLVVRFYNQQNEQIYQQNLPAQSKEMIDDNLLKQILKIRHKIIQNQYCSFF